MKKYLSSKNLFHISLFLALIVLDQISKYLAERFLDPDSKIQFLGFSLKIVKNQALAFGWNFYMDELFIKMILPGIFCVLLFYYILSLFFIPKSAYHLQIGITVLFAGFTGNFINKIFSGSVPDFIGWTGFSPLEIYFNLADIFQTIAWFLLFVQMVAFTRSMWTEKERRVRVFAMRNYQLQFIFYSLSAFCCISLFFLLTNYQLLRSMELNQPSNMQISWSFLKYSLFILFILLVFMGSFFIYISNKIYGSLYAFERFTRRLIKGENPPDLKLRKNDQLKHLEGLAKELKTAFKK